MSEYNLGQKMTDEELLGKSEKLYNLAKKLDPFLAQYGLENHTAQVALFIDASGSMEFDHCKFFTRGKVQTLVERMLPFAVRFDDNATIDAWLFSNHVSAMFELTPDNFEGAVDRMGWRKFMSGTNYVNVVDAIIDTFGTQTPRQHPVYVIWVTDGEPSGSKTAAINAVAKLAKLGIFVQFVALGEDWPVGDDLTPNQSRVAAPAPAPTGFFGKIAKAFGGGDDSSSGPQPRTGGMRFLVEMDEEMDVEVDSANAFAVKDPATVSEERLYNLMTREYPQWLPLAKQARLIA